MEENTGKYFLNLWARKSFLGHKAIDTLKQNTDKFYYGRMLKVCHKHNVIKKKKPSVQLGENMCNTYTKELFSII